MHTYAGRIEGKRVCVQWPRIGPYHSARLAASAEYFAARDYTITALETASRDDTYAWADTQLPSGFEHVRLFANANFDELHPADIHRSVAATLDELSPIAVAINSYSLPDARAALDWCRRHQRVAVLMMESRREDGPRNRLREWIKAQIVGQYDAALAGGSPQIAYLETLGFPTEMAFLPYDVVDNAHFCRGAAEARAYPERVRGFPGLGDEGPFFLSSNRFVARKNLGTLLRAYHEYRSLAASEGLRPWRLLLLGAGPQQAHLHEIVRSLRIEGVTFCGFRQFDELPAYYGLASAFVHPALSEQWGLVVNEAMAAGLPVLCARTVGAAKDLVLEGETGFTFDPFNQSQLANLLHRVASLAPEERAAIGERACARVAAWSPQAFAEGLWSAVQAGVGRRARPYSAVPRTILGLMAHMASRPSSFHQIRE